ncbi:hypothetical protein OQA88_4748 [Cercophora sp. LCS_1]
MRLQHIHLPHRAPSLYPPYTLASRVQEHLRRRHLDFKDDAVQRQQRPPLGVITPNTSPPAPILLSFTPLPTYTLGRRQTSPLADAESTRLQAPLRITHQGQGQMPAGTTTSTLPVTILHAPRGGLVTYHGPGQIVLWPVMDLKSPLHKQFTVRCYSRLLEDTTIAVLAKTFGIEAFTTEDPGVWTRGGKIAALGVHLRRHVSALGTAINIEMPGDEVVSEEMNPWRRIVACGLEGKTVTSATGEVDGGLEDIDRRLSVGGHVAREEAVAQRWAEELAGRISAEGVDAVGVEDVVAFVEDIVFRAGSGEEDVREEEREYVRGLQRLL